MLGFEPQISDVGSNRSANCATTMDPLDLYFDGLMTPNDKNHFITTC